MIAALSLVASLATAVAATYVAYRALVFSAKPRLSLTVDPPENSRRFAPGEQTTFMIHLHNVGYWYSKPAATEIHAFVNVDEGCDVLQLRYGSGLEISVDESAAKIGKGLHGGKSRYLEAFGIFLTQAEAAESMELTVRTPMAPGRYEGWVALFAKEGDCGVHSFQFYVQN